MSLEHTTHPTLVHPRTGEPLRAIGTRPDGTPLWPIMGGSGDEPDANVDDTADDQGPDAPGADELDTEDDTEDDADKPDPRVARANRQAAKYRTELREAQAKADKATETLEALRAAITGEDKAEGDTNADELAAQVQQSNARVSELEAQLLVHELAADNGANPVALLDSRSFTNALTGLDPADDDYRDQVAQAIKDAASKNANYRAGQGSSRGGGELNPERREQQRQRPAGLAGAIGAAYGK